MRTVLAVLALLLAGCGVQPTGPIGGSAATGALLYLVRDDAVVPVLRPTKHPTTGEQAVALLAEPLTGPEQVQGFTNRVPPEVAPVELAGAEVRLAADVTALSSVAVSQIVCTAALPEPVTLVGGGRHRGPLTCPV